MFQRDYLKIIAISFIAGVIFAYFLPNIFYQYHLIVFALAMIISVIYFVNYKTNLYLLIVFIFLLGIWRMAIYYPMHNIELGDRLNNESITLKGRLVEKKKNYDFSNAWWLSIDDIELDKKYLKPKNFKASLYIPRETDAHLGDTIKLNCLVKNTSDKRYRNYLVLNKVFLACARTSGIEIIEENKNFYLAGSKNKISSIFNKNLGPKYSGLAKALFLADKSDLDSSSQQLFSKSGISHILAISGLHIALWSSILFFFLFKIGLKRGQVAIITLSVVWFYVFFIGLPMSAWRAAIMLSFFVLAFLFKRLFLNMRSLAIACFVILIFSPLAWRFDLGFQLSFLAIAGIILYYPKLFKYINLIKLPNNFIFNASKKIITVTILAQLLTWPIISYTFNIFSFAAIITNLLVLWTLPILLVMLLIALLLYYIAPLAAVILFKIVNFIFIYIEFVSDLIIKLPYAYIEPKNSLAIYFIYYFIFLIFTFRTNIKYYYRNNCLKIN